MRVHHLPITKARFSVAPVDIKCPLCDSEETGDELHYLLKCPYFNEERQKLMPSNNHLLLYDPEKIFELCSSDLMKLSKFTKHIMKKFRIKKKNNDFNKQSTKQKTSRFGRELKPVSKLDM